MWSGTFGEVPHCKEVTTFAKAQNWILVSCDAVRKGAKKTNRKVPVVVADRKPKATDRSDETKTK